MVGEESVVSGVLKGVQSAKGEPLQRGRGLACKAKTAGFLKSCCFCSVSRWRGDQRAFWEGAWWGQGQKRGWHFWEMEVFWGGWSKGN